MQPSPNPPRKPHRGIYLLPNLLTTGGMFAGFYAIVTAIAGHPADAAVAVFLAGLLDGLDGRVARLTNTQSEFGVQYDSLSDMLSFGVAPALVLYTWSLTTLKLVSPLAGKLGFAAAFIYAACAAMRLARFNTQVGVIDKRYFQGLASPAAAGLAMSFVWTMTDLGLSGDNPFVQVSAAIVAVLAGLLMVSRIRYYSFKAWPLSDRVPFVWIPLALFVMIALYIDTPKVLLGIAVLYVISGPVVTLWGLRQWRSRHGGAPPRSEESPRP
ncbi:MAG: CDP-diacylglycerol--serine O-phosphatidyltransferase [Tahibacter sp.]